MLPATGAEWGGALRPIMRLVTLLAVADMAWSGEAMGSSTGEIGTMAAAALLPKLSFHFDGFFVTVAGGVDV